ncbi:MAG: NAD(P)H-hydrate dehydratase [Clostridiales bacterium]|jgi:hydroxyethylthiazole kinase-like uncharacterized protein yjeF|nr:NAD(P)H-hydrate dehydratase [Clostridiales bacterium]
MKPVVTPLQMRDIEQRAIAGGVSALLLMERAAEGLVDHLQQILGPLHGKAVAFFCGPGNNGGDGLAAARLLRTCGGKPWIVLLDRPVSTEAIHQWEQVQSLGLSVVVPDALPPVDAVVDALFGTGFNRAPGGEAAAMIEHINSLGVPVLAADIPSGMDGRGGTVPGVCVHACRTLSFQWIKAGHLLSHYPEWVGELHAADIGLELPGGVSGMLQALEPDDLKRLVPTRPRAAHKGSNGRALLYCGSPGMAGAAAMAALGCLRAGAGLTTIACEEKLFPILQMLVPNAQCAAIERVVMAPPRHDVLLAGCGLGVEETTWERLLQLYDPAQPAVLDADALTLLSRHPLKLGGNTLITPHVGEAARLLKSTVQAVAADLPAAAQALRQQYGGVVLLKSHCSVIHDGERTVLNPVGSPVLAKGGSGDALAGMATALMAQGLSAFDAGCTASLWLGRAAQLAEIHMGVHSPLTGEVLQFLGEAQRS